MVEIDFISGGGQRESGKSKVSTVRGSIDEKMCGSMENLRVVLVETRNPLNLGAVARAMSNFGVMHLRVVRPYERAFRGAVSAVGADAVMKNAEEFAAVAQAVADCSLVVGTTAVGNREIRQPLRSLEEAAPLVREHLEKQRVALLFGSEKRGLSNESLSYCHWLLRIPTREEHRSMNLGQAAAVCLYELAWGWSKRVDAEGPEALRRAEKRVGKNETGTQASMETIERIGEALLGVLKKSGYVGQRKNQLAEEKLRRMLRRFTIEETDAQVLLGMVRKILSKLAEREK